jgi:opacity protein-like surface antigen
MSRTTTHVFVATLIAVFAGQALAADVAQPKSREQVKAELAEAIRTGDILDNVTSQMLKDAYPERYRHQDTAQAKAADDKAKVAQAQLGQR